MGLFEDIFIKAKDAANNVGEKAGKLVDISKLNIEIAETKNKLKGKLENLGKIVYQNEKNGISNEKVLKEEVKKIDDVYAEIEDIKKELALIKKKVICKACGEENFSDAFYCSKCGHTLEIKCTCKPDSNYKQNSETCKCDSKEYECEHPSECNCGCRDSESSSSYSSSTDPSSESTDD